MSDSEPIIDLRPLLAGRSQRSATSGTVGAQSPNGSTQQRETLQITTFSRFELNEILRIYGRLVANGDWRDYAIDMGRETAVFSIYRRASEYPIYQIQKTPKLARRQGMYSVIAASGLVLKRGSDLKRVLAVLNKSLRLVAR